ncbi:MAG: hypothetical protein JWQ98_2252 [Chlorobi bacterium]|nr:hypothetical protein [Chlorobiota bacterium]
MRFRLLFGALALSAAMFCTPSVHAQDVTPAQGVAAQDAASPQAVVGAAAMSAGGIYVYPGGFPCTPGPGFCRRIIIIILSSAVCSVDHDYRNTGNVQMGVSESKKEAYVADINGRDLSDSDIMKEGETAYPTLSYDVPAGDLK